MGVIRLAVPAEVHWLREIERAAGVRFGEVGMADIAAATPMAIERLVAYARAGRAWVAVDDGEVVGYVVVDVVDGAAHVEQISVDARYQGRGYARAGLAQVQRWAAAQGLAALTLSTFAEVAWNRPLDEHLGFTVLGDGELSAGLRAVREAETCGGLDPSLRVCMRRVIPAADRPPAP